MNLLAPVSSLMTTHLIAVNPDDDLSIVKEIFEKNRIHHIPVVRHKTLLGIISSHDLENYEKGLSASKEDRFINDTLMRVHKAKDIMTTRMAKVESTDRLNVAVEVFKLNRFHALPVVDNDELVGILTVHDIILALAGDK
jgi:acetoin utilization protein AcuB